MEGLVFGILRYFVSSRLASHADVLRGSSRVPAVGQERVTIS